MKDNQVLLLFCYDLDFEFWMEKSEGVHIQWNIQGYS